MSCKAFLIKMVKKLVDTSPLTYPLVRYMNFLEEDGSFDFIPSDRKLGRDFFGTRPPQAFLFVHSFLFSLIKPFDSLVFSFEP